MGVDSQRGLHIGMAQLLLQGDKESKVGKLMLRMALVLRVKPFKTAPLLPSLRARMLTRNNS